MGIIIAGDRSIPYPNQRSLEEIRSPKSKKASEISRKTSEVKRLRDPRLFCEFELAPSRQGAGLTAAIHGPTPPPPSGLHADKIEAARIEKRIISLPGKTIGRIAVRIGLDFDDIVNSPCTRFH
jgi:hypothetical protein